VNTNETLSSKTDYKRLAKSVVRMVSPFKNPLYQLYEGLTILIEQKHETISWMNSEINVIHKTAALTSEPEHSNSWYASVALSEELPKELHDKLIEIGWSYEYPFYCFYCH
jgi:hypothetical protein